MFSPSCLFRSRKNATADRTASRGDAPGSRLLPTHRAAIFLSGSPAMGVVKLPRVCELSFHSKGDEVASKGVKREGLTLWDVLPRVCGRACSLDRPTCYPCPADPDFGAGSHYALYEHVEASERTQSPIGSLPRGADGRAPLTKAIGLKKTRSSEVLKSSAVELLGLWQCFVAWHLSLTNEAQFLGRLAASAHFPDVDGHSSSHRYRGFFLDHFIAAAQALAPLHNGRIVGLKTR